MKSPELRKAEIRANLSLSHFEDKVDQLADKVEATGNTLQDNYEKFRRFGPVVAAAAAGFVFYLAARSFYRHRFKS